MARPNRHASREAVYRNGEYAYSIKLKDVESNLAYNFLRRNNHGLLEEVESIEAPAVPSGTWDGYLGVGNALPFGKVQSKFQKPHALHYEIPALGDHRIKWLSRFMEKIEPEMAPA